MFHFQWDVMKNNTYLIFKLILLVISAEQVIVLLINLFVCFICFCSPHFRRNSVLEIQVKVNKRKKLPVEVFTRVRPSIDGRIHSDSLQVVMAALFVLLQRCALFVTPSTIVALVRFSH